jgi:hypothetical protein
MMKMILLLLLLGTITSLSSIGAATADPSKKVAGRSE